MRIGSLPATVPANSLAQHLAGTPAQIAEVDNVSGLLALLKIEAEAREAVSRQQLLYLIANESRKLTRARQIFVFLPGPGRVLRVEVISGLAVVERNSPIVQWVEHTVTRMAREVPATKLREFELKAYASGYESSSDGYPFQSAVWIPMLGRSGQLFGGMLLTSEAPWTQSDLVIGDRLAKTYAHALSELSRGWARKPRHYLRRWLIGVGAIAALLALILPVSMKALAPFEIVARDPFIVAAPIEGIIDQILVQPNQPVAIGQTLVKFSDTVLKNRLAVAEREQMVAKAQVRKNMQLAFDDVRGQHELSVAMSDLQLKTAERDFASDLLQMSEIKASRSGIAVYTDNNEFTGRPFAVGERIMQIANPQSIEVAIDLPISDAIVLQSGGDVSLYFDSDPLHPQSGRIVSADYQARPRPGNTLAFRIVARLAEGASVPRLGLRGTAQLYGRSVPLGFYLFRRPLAAARQWLGL